jgi:uncharacterized protein (TIGR02266 family)
MPHAPEHALSDVVAFEAHDPRADHAHAAEEDGDTLVRRKRTSALGTTEAPTLDPADRRTARRIPIEIDVMVHSADHLFPATTADISSGGMFVTTFRDLAVGTHVVVDFKLPSGVELEIEGSVRWRRDEPGGGVVGVAVAFDGALLDAVTHHVLEAFCEVRAPLYCGVAC